MPRQRMVLSISEELHETLKEFSEVSGVAASSFVAEWIELAKPQLEGLIETFKLLKQDKLASLDKLNELMAENLHVASNAQMDILDSKKKFRKSRDSKNKE